MSSSLSVPIFWREACHPAFPYCDSKLTCVYLSIIEKNVLNRACSACRSQALVRTSARMHKSKRCAKGAPNPICISITGRRWVVSLSFVWTFAPQNMHVSLYTRIYLILVGYCRCMLDVVIGRAAPLRRVLNLKG